MRKIALLFVIAVSLATCKTSNSGTMTSKPRRINTANKAVKGEWTLQSITYSQSSRFSVTLLSDTLKECSGGSTWKFVSNNNRGHYTINASDCSIEQRSFISTVQGIDRSTGYYDFLLKPTNKRYVSKGNQGIRLHLASLSGDSVVWKQALKVNDRPFVISMNFVK